MLKEKHDIPLMMAKNQGYVHSSCSLNGELVMGLVNSGANPCDGCNIKCDKK